jgi:polysaccharide biosynthesis transport protein
MLPTEKPQLDPSANSTPLPRLPVLAYPSPNGTPARLSPLPRPAPLPPALARALTFRSLMAALRRQWVLALSAALAVGVVVGCVVYAALPPTRFGAYTARASLRISATAPVVVAQAEKQNDFDTYKKTIQARVTSRLVLARVLDQPEVKELTILAAQADPYEFLQNELFVDWPFGSEILSIRVIGDRPKELAVLVNAVADAALEDVNGGEVRARKNQIEQLEKVQADYEHALSPQRRKLEELTRGAGLESGQQTLRQVFAAMALNARQMELVKVRSERRNAEALLKLPARPIDPAPQPTESKAALDDLMKNDPDLRPLRTQIADLNGQIAHYATLYRDNPDRAKQIVEEKGLQTQIDALYALARQKHDKKVQALGGRPGPEPARGVADSTEELKARVASCEATEETLSQEIKNLEGDLRGLEVKSGEIDAIKQEIAVRDAVSKDVAMMLEKQRQEVAARPRAVKLEEATVPTVREERRLKFAGLGGLGGAALALFAMAFLDVRRRKLHTIADVTRGLELPVAGTQPLLPAELNPLDRRHSAAKGAVPWYSLLNDSLDATRALLLRDAPPTAPRVVAVVCAVGGEGGSVLAVQLAASLARAGRRTLLLDANLRRPAVHRAFGIDAGPGLAEVLRGEAALTKVVRPAPAERLWWLPAGAADLRALLALSRENVQVVLDQLKRDYEYIVIDCAPVMPCADALLLAQRADTVLVSVLAGTSGLPTVHTAWQRLSVLGAQMLGVVVQGAADDGLPRLQYRFRQG